jgi:hypothetical protein
MEGQLQNEIESQEMKRPSIEFSGLMKDVVCFLQGSKEEQKDI